MQTWLAVPLLSLLISLPAFAAGKASCNKHYLLGVNTQFVAKNQPSIPGVVRDLIDEIKRRVPCTYQELPLSFNKAAEELKARRIDFYAFAYKVDDWMTFADIEVLYSVERLLLVEKKFYSKQLTVADYLKKKDLSFVTISGGTFFTSNDELDILIKDKRAVYVPYPDNILDALIQGKARAAFTSATYFSTHKNRALLEQRYEIVRDPDYPMPLGLYMAKGRVHPEDRKKFQKALKEMRDDGTIHRILKKYIPQDILEKYYSI